VASPARKPDKGGNLGLGAQRGTVPHLLGWRYSYLYPPTIPEVSEDAVVAVG